MWRALSPACAPAGPPAVGRTARTPKFLHGLGHTMHAPSFPASTPTADAGAGSKAATLSSGAIVQVPSFLDVGTKVKVDTRTGSYLVSAGAGPQGVAGLVLRSMRGRAQPQLSVKAAHDCACHQPQHCPHHLHPPPPNRLQSKAN